MCSGQEKYAPVKKTALRRVAVNRVDLIDLTQRRGEETLADILARSAVRMAVDI